MVTTCFFFIPDGDAIGMPNLTDPVIDPSRHPAEELCDHPPAARDIGDATFFIYGADDLTGDFVYRRHPKPRPFGHLRVDEARLDIGYVEGDPHFAGFDV